MSVTDFKVDHVVKTFSVVEAAKVGGCSDGTIFKLLKDKLLDGTKQTLGPGKGNIVGYRWSIHASPAQIKSLVEKHHPRSGAFHRVELEPIQAPEDIQGKLSKKDLWTVPEIAKIAKVSAQAIYGWIQTNKIKKFYTGQTQFVISRADAARCLENYKRTEVAPLPKSAEPSNLEARILRLEELYQQLIERLGGI